MWRLLTSNLRYAMSTETVKTPDLIPTRRSLLSRLRDWQDDEGWQEFFDTYWRLIYEVARKTGLADAEAQDVVQETLISVSRQMPEFRYDPARGKFKGWLLQITRRRIADIVRKRKHASATGNGFPAEVVEVEQIENLPAAEGEGFEALWAQEWERHILATAVARVTQQVRPEHYQLFDLYVLQQWPIRKIAATLRVNAGQVYLAKHRVGALIKKEIKLLDCR